LSYDNTVQRVYRETIASYGAAGVNRREAEEAAENILMAEVNAGRLLLDQRRALRSELRRVDEADGRAADRLIERLAYGEAPLVAADLEVVVTLGSGMRKAWHDVVPSDLAMMVELRQDNVNKARASMNAFRAAVARIRETVFEYGTVGAAFEAGGFPPKTAESGVA
jgi:hypothetical protein